MGCSYHSGCGFHGGTIQVDLGVFINLRCENSIEVIISSGVCACLEEAREGR